MIPLLSTLNRISMVEVGAAEAAELAAILMLSRLLKEEEERLIVSRLLARTTAKGLLLRASTEISLTILYCRLSIME